MDRSHSEAVRQYSQDLLSVKYVKGATLKQVQAICPHLPPEVLADHFAGISGGNGKHLYFVTPGVRVLGAIHHLSLYQHEGDVILTRSGASNVHAGDRSRSSSLGQQEALEWQAANIDDLIDPCCPPTEQGQRAPRWVNFKGCSVQDPGKHRKYRRDERGNITGVVDCEYDASRYSGTFPTTVAGIAFAYRVHPNDFNNTEAGRAVVGWQREEDHADLIIHSADGLLWEEVKGSSQSQSGAPTHFCSRCGSSLDLTGCGHCQLYFPDDQFRCGGGPCIGPKAQALLEQHGHTFLTNPQIARDRDSQAHNERLAQHQETPR